MEMLCTVCQIKALVSPFLQKQHLLFGGASTTVVNESMPRKLRQMQRTELQLQYLMRIKC